MKQKKVEFKDLLKESNMNFFPFSYNNLFFVIHSNSKPAHFFKGRKMNSLQNENMTIKGNGLRIPISKFITE
ncbi:hypothetical protein FLAV_01186 [Flavobacteriales bacterium]|nr:hypothetical protein FLAV_01186 [Flavobacteriales bacterium]